MGAEKVGRPKKGADFNSGEKGTDLFCLRVNSVSGK